MSETTPTLPPTPFLCPEKLDVVENFVHSLHTQKPPSSCTVVAVQGVQGCGKSYGCEMIRERLRSRGLVVEVLSLDDFYFPRVLMKTGNLRGHPGTHDVHLLSSCLDGIQERERVDVPVYNKYAFSGKGDRAGHRTVEAPVDVVLIEGWCLGFSPLDNRSGFETPLDSHVAEYDRILTPRFDGIVLMVSPMHMAFRWREAAEQRARDQGKTAMTPHQLREFVQHYIPVYAKYLEPLHRKEWTIPVCRIEGSQATLGPNSLV